jgi:hypothetical protein
MGRSLSILIPILTSCVPNQYLPPTQSFVEMGTSTTTPHDLDQSTSSPFLHPHHPSGDSANNQNSWGGKGAKKSKKNPKFLVKTAGIEPALRKDFTTSNVIITEKKDRKAAAFQVKDLPYPYTSVEQFEARFKTPLGSEWNSRAVHQKETMPRVVKKVCPFLHFTLLHLPSSSHSFLPLPSGVYRLHASLISRGIMLTYSLVRLSSLSEGYSRSIMCYLPISLHNSVVSPCSLCITWHLFCYRSFTYVQVRIVKYDKRASVSKESGGRTHRLIG